MSGTVPKGELSESVATAIIGAGPYGLSTAAHLRAVGHSTAIFGKPLGFWRAMPAGLYLKSPWTASSLSTPARRLSLDRYLSAAGGRRVEPIPVPMFLDYCEWFIREGVGPVDETLVQCLTQQHGSFRLQLVDGRVVEAGRVVVAAGIAPFARVPEFAQRMPPGLVSHSQDLRDPSVFKGRSVAVIGAGQSALETAALLAEAGAGVELIARERVRWADRRLYERTGFLRHLFYPPSDVGPVGLNWLVSFPLMFRHVPDSLRLPLAQRAIRPGGAKWLKGRFVEVVKTTEMSYVSAAYPDDFGVRLILSDGGVRIVDHVVCGTGYQPELSRLTFIDPRLLKRIQQCSRRPTLNTSFESSVPRLHFIGAIADYTFGPLCRFVAGAATAASRVTAAAVRDG